MSRNLTWFVIRLALLALVVSGGLMLLTLGVSRGVPPSALVFSRFDGERGQYYVYLDPYLGVSLDRDVPAHDGETTGMPPEPAPLSPDGSRTVMPRVTEDGVDLFVSDTGGRLTRLTHRSDFATASTSAGDMRSNTYPLWSPDGQWISFVSTRPQQEGVDLYLVSAEGSALRRVYANLTTRSPLGLRWIAVSGELFSPWLALAALVGVVAAGGYLRFRARQAA